MNKYQRALDELDDGFHNLNNNDVDKIVAVFKELVDKATPKKVEEPLRLEQGLCGECPHCTAFVQNSNYCGHCGQKLDWSENE